MEVAGPLPNYPRFLALALHEHRIVVRAVTVDGEEWPTSIIASDPDANAKSMRRIARQARELT
jgi:hypothetical protein